MKIIQPKIKIFMNQSSILLHSSLLQQTKFMIFKEKFYVHA